jgi:2-polyprenyl-6-methoxyphenol hydroxylase-like FAD-dependent oxidoreductase
LQDIVIIGGGFAGSAAAIVLGRAGHKVTLIDVNASYPPLFRAEKVAGDQLELLRQCGLLELLTSAATLTTQHINIRGRRIIDRPPVRDYGMSYQNMVDLLRRNLPSEVFFVRSRVSDVQTGPNSQRVMLADGGSIETRLAVIATGQGDALRRKVGFESQKRHPLPTISVGFLLEAPAGGFGFPALTAYGEKCGDGIDYISIFPLGDLMRANFFFFADVRDPRVKALQNKGIDAVCELLPGLRRWIGDCRVAGKIDIHPVELSKCSNVVRDGVVLIGDSFRTSCPAVGTGLTCAMTDVVRLRQHVAEWLTTPGMDAAKIASFYADPVKLAREADAYQGALSRRDYAVRRSFLHCLRRNAHFAKRALIDRLGRRSLTKGHGTVGIGVVPP